MLSKFRVIIVLLLLASLGYLPWGGTLASAASTNLDQCRNGVTSPPLGNLTTPCGDGSPFPSWVNGNVGGSNSQYREGDGLPYRLIVTGLADGTHSVTLQYDFTKNGKFAVDRLTGHQAR